MEERKFLDFFFKSMPMTVNDTLKKSNLTINEIEYLALHQVHQPIFDTWRNDIGCKNTKCISTVDKFGNCGNPNALINLIEGRHFYGKGDNVLLVAATFSFSVGSLIFKW